MTIRPYREADRESLQRITIICFEGVSIDRNIDQKFPAREGRDWRWRKARDIDADIAVNPGGVLVAEAEDGAVAGFVTVRLDREARLGRIANLAVDPARQRQGLGRRLIEAALDYMKREGMTLAKIETLAQNAVGTKFYPKLGFGEVARQVHYVMAL